MSAADSHTAKKGWYVPVTPGGTPVPYGAACRMGKTNAARTREQAIKNLLEDGAHMPYGDDWKVWEERGYTIEHWTGGWKP